MDDLRNRAIALYDDYTHRHLDRRRFFANLTRLAGSAAAAQALIVAIAADPAAAAIVSADDARIRPERVTLPGVGASQLKGYFVRPAGRAKHPAVLVVHENRGLNAHIEDVARRLAVAGYAALALDFLSPVGGTPVDEDEARTRISALDLAQAAANGVAALGWLHAHKACTGKVGAVGFCWGGAMVNRIAVAAGDRLDAGVAFYGPAPDPAEAVKVKAPLLLHYAGLDARVNATGFAWAKALQAAGKTVEMFEYPGVNHAFHNDTSAERYDKAAAELAWGRTLDFFGKHLG